MGVRFFTWRWKFLKAVDSRSNRSSSSLNQHLQTDIQTSVAFQHESSVETALLCYVHSLPFSSFKSLRFFILHSEHCKKNKNKKLLYPRQWILMTALSLRIFPQSSSWPVMLNFIDGERNLQFLYQFLFVFGCCWFLIHDFFMSGAKEQISKINKQINTTARFYDFNINPLNPSKLVNVTVQLHAFLLSIQSKTGILSCGKPHNAAREVLSSIRAYSIPHISPQQAYSSSWEKPMFIKYGSSSASARVTTHKRRDIKSCLSEPAER